ncbi:hypothetical protein EJ04DRAFT_473792 [Polyplosphaeria fusca]|uniref:Uncharacterized protein n=1 Tax=Polyplosphaeria fusca TaxID=682080 RepID=A0A9P4UYT9_9PLEO|nr:hypothetical protein EJ04DRAFT_473792 [Polyplosphaeria fusca]
MGRQAYLTRLALGRSAFEPNHSTASSFDVQLEPLQHEPFGDAHVSDSNSYTQLYDDRGNPINPRAREHGRRFREAQNDVLASIGVVEVVARRRLPSEDLPGAFDERMKELEHEQSMGDWITRGSVFGGSLCTWWIGSLRDRLLTFRFHNAMPFAQIVASEFERSGRSMIYSGYVTQHAFTFGVRQLGFLALSFRPVDRILLALRATRKTKLALRWWRSVINFSSRMVVEALLYPFVYHSTLQRLGLLPPRPLLPSWKAFIPFSSSSPLKVLPLPAELGLDSLLDWTGAAIASPLVFVCLVHVLEQWVYAAICETIDTSTLRPENPDSKSLDNGLRRREPTIVGVRTTPPSPIRRIIIGLLSLLGWGKPLPQLEIKGVPARSTQRRVSNIQQAANTGHGELFNVSQLQIPIAHEGVRPGPRPAEEVATVALQLLDPTSPTASDTSQDGNDPRIRITSREGIVEMEVRLPPHVLSTREEIVDVHSPGSASHDLASPVPAYQPEIVPHHRVTRLSTQPARMISAVCKVQIVAWAVLPLKLVCIRLIASHYRAHGPVSSDIASGVYRTVLPTLWAAERPSLKSAGVLLSRVALAGALEFTIDLALWGFQWVAVTWVGKKSFGWGNL